VLCLVLKCSFNEVELPFVLGSTGFIKKANSRNPSLRDFIIPGFAVFDLFFQLIIQMSFKMIAEGGVIKNRWGVTEEAVEGQELLGLIPKQFARRGECGCENLVVNLILPVVLEVIFMEFLYESIKGEGGDVCMIGSDPVTDTYVFNSRKDERNLFFGRD